MSTASAPKPGRSGGQSTERRNTATIVAPYAPAFYASTTVRGCATILEAVGSL